MTAFQRIVFEEVDVLGGNAYGLTVMKAVEARRGRMVSIGAIYVALEELVEAGWLRAQMGEATAERGWRRKRYYWVARRPEEER